MSQNYYKIIDGHKYDSEIIELADQAVAGRGDGRISLEDANLLLAGVKDANKYTDIEKATMRYIRDNYRFTPASNRWFRTQIRSWAATRGWAGHIAEEDKESAAGHEAETAVADDIPPPVGISGGPESPQSNEQAPPHEQAPPPTPTASPAPPAPASPPARTGPVDTPHDKPPSPDPCRRVAGRTRRAERAPTRRRAHGGRVYAVDAATPARDGLAPRR